MTVASPSTRPDAVVTTSWLCVGARSTTSWMTGSTPDPGSGSSTSRRQSATRPGPGTTHASTRDSSTTADSPTHSEAERYRGRDGVGWETRGGVAVGQTKTRRRNV